MQPSKNMMDYMTELNRLFKKTPENDIRTPFQPRFNHPTPNYSSSSTDSFSPETFPELSYRRPEHRPETPFAIARRPIVGRKILGNPEQRPIDPEPVEPRIWEHTPPKAEYMKNYELFPENKAYEFRTPVKSNVSPVSPASSMSQTSPVGYGMFTTPYLSLANSPVPMSPRNLVPSTSRYQDVHKMCTFCRKNGETPLVYMTHSVKEKQGNRNIVSCPILRSHVCSTCGASGDNAHTITYCPVLRSSNNGMPLMSTTITLKNTRIKSNGRRRY